MGQRFSCVILVLLFLQQGIVAAPPASLTDPYFIDSDCGYAVAPSCECCDDRIPVLACDADTCTSIAQRVDALSDKLTITTRDKSWSLTVFGSLTGEMIAAEQRAVIPSGIVFLSPNLGRDTPTIDVHGKQSSLGLSLEGPWVGDLRAGGLVLTYFYGESFLEDQQGLFIPRGFAELKNEDWRFAFGALGDVVNPRIPGTLDFIKSQGSGNLGYFRGQFRAERYLRRGDQVQWTLQGALTNPLTTSFVGEVRTLVEDNGWPNIEGRIMLGAGPETMRGPIRERPFELAISGLAGQIRRVGDRFAVFDVWAFGADMRFALSDNCGIKGEFFHGQAIGNYNAAIVQIFNPVTLQAIRTTGGWLEIYRHWNDSLRSHFAVGVDDPLEQDLSPGLPSKNQFAFANLIWDVTRSFEMGVEIGRYQTDYAPGAVVAGIPIRGNHSMVYRTRVSLKF